MQTRETFLWLFTRNFVSVSFWCELLFKLRSPDGSNYSAPSVKISKHVSILILRLQQSYFSKGTRYVPLFSWKLETLPAIYQIITQGNYRKQKQLMRHNFSEQINKYCFFLFKVRWFGMYKSHGLPFLALWGTGVFIFKEHASVTANSKLWLITWCVVYDLLESLQENFELQLLSLLL